ncbi:MAG: CRISPR-associated helicase Cas3' [Prevotella sp.]|nr:CRISPR-associated helicase Cas3' [Prevotella sp.]
MEYNDKTYIAHSANSCGIMQTMKEHCLGVGKFMREFALSESFEDLYEFCGLIHDMGKYSDSFQKHISGVKNIVRHSIYGAIFAKEKSLMEVAIPIYGHHAGMPNCPDMLQDMKAELKSCNDTYNEICTEWSKDTDKQVTIPNNQAFRDIPDVLQKELFVRMLFSSIVDADSLDTERHFSEERFNARTCLPLNPNLLLNKLQEKRLRSFENDLDNKSQRINILRNSVRLYAESKANLPLGFYSLTLPTGMGKTLCSINWALHHAQYHRNIKRIIVVLPFISIIDQTAEEFKSIFNDDECDYVLEHHSNVIHFDNEDNDEYSSKQLATENWDYPIIVTTAVQFFESLFSNKRSACRKLHNIQDSIVIFDEIQTLPLYVTEPTLAMLDNLQQLCRCSLLFCTATQPDFNSRKGFCGINHIESLVEYPQRIFDETRRVKYHSIDDYNELSISELADIVVKNRNSSLVIFNTKKKARLFFDELSGNNSYKLFYLSTTMCPIHRKEEIQSIRKALENNESIIVSSTQLIEAGVDMDFPTVYRELAPLESIIQSAGRCNREGKEVKGDVYLFKLIESSQPSREYRTFLEFANLLYKGNEEKLYTHDFYSFYYRELVKNYADTDKLSITEDRKNLLFQTVAEKYKIIDSKTQTLFVYDYSEDSKQLYYQIKDKEYLSRQERQQIAQYSVQVYDKFIEDNKSFIGYERCGLLVWHGSYSSDYGLSFNEEINVLIK